MRSTRLRIAMATAATLLLGASAAFAQADPVFSLENVSGRAGDTVAVRVFVTGGVANTSALNFTVRVDPADAALVDSITGSSPREDGANYAYADNTLNVAGTKEYRGVLYAQTSSVTPFSTVNQTHVATLNVTLAAGAADNSVINLNFRQFSDDNTTGLVGLSDSAGNSIVEGVNSPSSTRPKVQNGTITVGGFGFDVDLRGINDLPAGWEFAQVIPSEQGSLVGAQNNANGFGMTFNTDATFGFVQRLNDANSQPENGRVMVTSWTLGSTGASAFDVPTMRVRSTSEDSSWTQDALIQETQPSTPAPVTVPTAGNDKVLTALTYVPMSVANGVGPNGFSLAADVIAFGTTVLNGTPGTTNYVRRLEVRDFAPSALVGEAEIVNYDFTGGNQHGFVGAEDIAGLQTTLTTAGGLGVVCNDVIQSISAFPLGWWEKTVTEWVADGSKVYRVDYNFSSTASSRDKTNVGRIRVTAGANADFVATAVVGSSGDTSQSPDADGENYTAFFYFPNDVAGQQIKVSFDVYNTDPGDEGGVILRNLRVRSYNAPFAN